MKRNIIRKVFALIVIIVVSISMIYDHFIDNEPDTIDAALNDIMMANEDFEIPVNMIDEIHLENDMVLCLYTTQADTIGFAFVDCSDEKDFNITCKGHYSIGLLYKERIIKASEPETNGIIVNYTLSVDEFENSKKYTAVFQDSSKFDFYFAYTTN